jgi:hypothetical protein
MCVGIWTLRYGGQQDYPFDRFMGACFWCSLHGFQNYQTKKTRRDYPGSRHSEAKDPMSCEWCILVALHTRDLILSFLVQVWSQCVCVVLPPSSNQDASLLRSKGTSQWWAKRRPNSVGPAQLGESEWHWCWQRHVCSIDHDILWHGYGEKTKLRFFLIIANIPTCLVGSVDFSMLGHARRNIAMTHPPQMLITRDSFTSSWENPPYPHPRHLH